jgi:hypothetical protein
MASRKIRQAKETITSRLDGIEVTGSDEDLELIYDEFNNHIMSLLRMLCERCSEDPHVSTLKNIIEEASGIDNTILLRKCKDKFWVSREHIRNKSAKFFIDNSHKEWVKQDQNETMILGLISTIQNGWKTLYDHEREAIWKHTNIMLDAIVNHEICMRLRNK